jgi:biopolymer transport protein ExbD
MKFKKTTATVPEVDMTPMIDIVFQLIAFFMVITNFEQTQADERVKLPKNELAKPPEVKRENVLTLNIGFDRNLQGEKTDDNAVVFFNGEEVPLNKMPQYLLTEAQFYKAIKTPIDEVTVQIRADSEVPIGMVQKLIKMCQSAAPSENDQGFQRFALAAKQEVR